MRLFQLSLPAIGRVNSLENKTEVYLLRSGTLDRLQIAREESKWFDGDLRFLKRAFKTLEEGNRALLVDNVIDNIDFCQAAIQIKSMER